MISKLTLKTATFVCLLSAAGCWRSDQVHADGKKDASVGDTRILDGNFADGYSAEGGLSDGGQIVKCAPLDVMQDPAVDCGGGDFFLKNGSECTQVCACIGADCDKGYPTRIACELAAGECVADPCRAMDAAQPINGACPDDDLLPAYWDGNSCQETCGCVGEDCDILFDNLGACESAYRQCSGKTCVTMDAAFINKVSCAGQTLLYLWNGDGCVPGCRRQCHGSECDALYPSLQACQEAYPGCIDPPAASCEPELAAKHNACGDILIAKCSLDSNCGYSWNGLSCEPNFDFVGRWQSEAECKAAHASCESQLCQSTGGKMVAHNHVGQKGAVSAGCCGSINFHLSTSPETPVIKEPLLCYCWGGVFDPIKGCSSEPCAAVDCATLSQKELCEQSSGVYSDDTGLLDSCDCPLGTEIDAIEDWRYGCVKKDLTLAKLGQPCTRFGEGQGLPECGGQGICCASGGLDSSPNVCLLPMCSAEGPMCPIFP